MEINNVPRLRRFFSKVRISELTNISPKRDPVPFMKNPEMKFTSNRMLIQLNTLVLSATKVLSVDSVFLILKNRIMKMIAVTSNSLFIKIRYSFICVGAKAPVALLLLLSAHGQQPFDCSLLIN